MRLTRRAFLGGLAATASALALDPQITSASVRGRALPLAPRGSAPRIAIIGAGIAGLSAALALRDRGVSSVVYEAQSRVGGRMHSERAFWDNGQVSEYGGELIDTAHTTIRALAKRFDLPLADVLAGVPVACEETIFEAGSYYTQHDLYADFRAFYPIISGHVRDAGYATTFAHSTPTGRALDAMSLATYIERFVPGGSKSRLGQYVLLQYTSEYGIDAHRQSALNMVYWLGRQNAYDPKTGEFVTLGPSDERYHIVGGQRPLATRDRKRASAGDGADGLSSRSDRASPGRAYLALVCDPDGRRVRDRRRRDRHRALRGVAESRPQRGALRCA